MGRWVMRTERKQAGMDRVAALRFAARMRIRPIGRPEDPARTVGEDYHELMARMWGGDVVFCHTCQRPARIYRNRRISVRTAADFLRLVYLWLKKPGPTKIDDFLPGEKTSKGAKRSSDISYLAKWGLLRREGKGIYELLPDGLAFALGKLRVPGTLTIYANKLRGLGGGLVTIRDTLRPLPGRKQQNREGDHDRFMAWFAAEGSKLLRKARRYWAHTLKDT